MSFPVLLLAAVGLMIQVACLGHAGALMSLAVLVITQKAFLRGALLFHIGFALFHLETDVTFCVRRGVFLLQTQESGGFVWPRTLISHLLRS